MRETAKSEKDFSAMKSLLTNSILVMQRVHILKLGLSYHINERYQVVIQEFSAAEAV